MTNPCGRPLHRRAGSSLTFDGFRGGVSFADLLT
jgi:hypothetical protein